MCQCVYTPIEHVEVGVALLGHIEPGVQLQGGLLLEGWQDEGEHHGQAHEPRRQDDLEQSLCLIALFIKTLLPHLTVLSHMPSHKYYWKQKT